jgi:hypothetical protein
MNYNNGVIYMTSLREKIEMMMNEKGEYDEELILLIINEKVKRYEDLKDKIDSGIIRETAGVIDGITKLENSITESVEKYLKLKHPQKYSIRLLKDENKDMISRDEYNEMKLLFEQIGGLNHKRK